jgi:hypothetical protein
MQRSILRSCLVLSIVGCGDNDSAKPISLQDVAISTAEDTAVAVDVPVTASDASAVTYAIATPPTHGTLDGAGPSWTYTPAADYTGSDTFVVQASDVTGSDTATVTLAVSAVNDAPVANPDSLAAGFSTALTIAQAALLANDTDVDGPTLALTMVGAEMHGAVSISGTDVVFTPETGYAGAASFMYTISDGALMSATTVTLTVGIDIAPVAVDDAATTDEDVALDLADSVVLANDTDAENHTLTVMAVGAPTHGTVSHTGTTITFVPEPNYNGPASFEYTVSDGFLTDTGTVVVTINPVDDAPVAVNDAAIVDEGAAATAIDVLANDTDVDGGPKLVTAVGTPAHGTAAVGAGGANVTYAPTAGYCNTIPNGTRDTFTYTLNGGSIATVSVTVTCACDAGKTTDFVVGAL